jgi:hypothetical protein
LTEHCGLGDEVELQAGKGALPPRPVRSVRVGWADAFNRMAATGGDHLVHEDAPTATQFDTEEWQW